MYPKIKFHPLLFITAFLCAITGHFKQFIIFMTFIMVHECGHIYIALFFKWKMERIIILPFGGITIFKEKINRPLKEEFLISIAGVLLQHLFYLFSIHFSILLFNLLPIYPLDGAKIYHILLNYLFSFKLSHITMLITSLLFLILGFLLEYRNLFFFLTFSFLMIEWFKEVGRHQYVFEKFLLERYLYSMSFYRVHYIKGKNLKKMKRDCKHLFIINEKVYLENKVLRDLFDRKV